MSVSPPSYRSGTEKTPVILAKAQCQVTPKHAFTIDAVKSKWANYKDTVSEPIRKRAQTQLVREHSATVVLACLATVDDPNIKSGISVRELIST